MRRYRMAYFALFSALTVHTNDGMAQTKADDDIDEIVVRAKPRESVTEMTEATERLLSVAGAATDPLQALYSLPGVTFSNGFVNEPVVRGSAPQDNAYYVDLVPVSYVFHNFGNSIFDRNVIHDFALLPAAFPSQYGNATGGIIDVSLRKPRNQEFTTTLHGSFLISGAMVESGIGKNQAFYASYRRSMMDLVFGEDDFADDEVGFDVDQLPISDDYQFKYDWQINQRNSLSLVAAGANDELGATFSDGNNAVERDPDLAGPARIVQGFDSQGLTWDWQGNGRNLTTVLSHISDDQNFDYGADQREHTAANRHLLRSIYSQTLNDRHRLSVGVSGERVSYDLDFDAKIVACSDFDPDCPTIDAEFVSFNDTLDMTSTELFIEDEIRLGARQSLTLGLRYSADDYLGSSRVEPRATWQYGFGRNWHTSVSAGQYSQLPELREMIDVLGNPELTTVKADHVSWALGQTFNNGWSWTTDLYYKNLSDVVTSDDTRNYINGADGRAYGLELLVDKKLNDRWYGWASLSLARTDRSDKLTGAPVRFQYDKPVLFNLVMNRLIGENWTVGIKWTYQSGGRYTPVTHLVPNSGDATILEPVYGELNSERLPDYHRLDFRAEYLKRRDWGHIRFFVDILNVYNQENVTGYDYAPNGQDLIAPPPGFGADVPVSSDTAFGLLPSIGVEVQF